MGTRKISWMAFNQVISPIVQNACNLFDIDKMEQELREQQHPVILAVFGAMDDMDPKITRPRNNNLFHTAIVLGVYKCMMSDQWRYVLTEFLYHLRNHLSITDLEPYRRPSKGWKVNRLLKGERKEREAK